MGYVDIPDRPPAGGRCKAELILEPHELRVTIDLLKAVLNKFTEASSNGVVTEQEFMGLSRPLKAAECIPLPSASSSGSTPVPNSAAAAASLRDTAGPIAAPVGVTAAAPKKPSLNVDAPAFVIPGR
jgi:hypothetical protein